jgi:hypothetical protein
MSKLLLSGVALLTLSCACFAPRTEQAAPAAAGVRAYGLTTGTDYGPHATMADAAAVETLRRSHGGVNAMEPIQIR